MLTVITPTRSRPEAFNNLAVYMARQTLQPDRWIVVNDGTLDYTYPSTCEVHKRTSSSKLPQVSICENYLHAINLLEGNQKVIFCEDDDWYSKDFLQVMSGLLDEADMVGVVPAFYYNTKHKAAARWPNKLWAALAQTGITQAVIPLVKEACFLNCAFIDSYLWNHWSGSRKLLEQDDENPLHVGIKDGAGAGMGHLLSQPKDKDGSILRSLVGQDAGRYQ